MPQSGPVPWSVAMELALYGPEGFYVAGPGAGASAAAAVGGHYRTSASSLSVRAIFAGAVGELLIRVDSALGQPDPLDLVDVGAGSGQLLAAVLDVLGADLATRVRPTAVELGPRPAGASPRLRWLAAVPEMQGLLIANEWLDNVAVDVVADDRIQLVDASGVESPGPPPTAAEQDWLTHWWPDGQRREVGLGRDMAWAAAMATVGRGLAVAIDYAHQLGHRPPYGTLTGFRAGRETEPIPDARRDVTAHVAIDSVLAAGEAAVSGAGRVVRSLVTDQRTALKSLGVNGRLPSYEGNPGTYATGLQRASESAELIEPAGLGAFSWLLQGVDLDPAHILLPPPVPMPRPVPIPPPPPIPPVRYTTAALDDAKGEVW